MEDELRCPVCKQLFNNPVLLPCYHALCLNCALHLQQPASQHPPQQQPAAAVAQPQPPPAPELDVAGGGEASSTSSSAGGGSAGGDYQEVDKLSILSETDSGVVCNSRPNSYVGTPNIQGILFPPLLATTTGGVLSLACPVCHKMVYFDESGAHNLPKYRAMQGIVDRYGESRRLALKCQLCEGEPAEDAAVMCEQCEVLYCERCRENCHPARGPLAKHTLLEPTQGRAALRARARGRDVQCSEHEDEALSMYCMVCKVPVCPLCLHDTRHTSHDVQAINSMCKAQKVKLQAPTKTPEPHSPEVGTLGLALQPCGVENQLMSISPQATAWQHPSREVSHHLCRCIAAMTLLILVASVTNLIGGDYIIPPPPGSRMSLPLQRRMPTLPSLQRSFVRLTANRGLL